MRSLRQHTTTPVAVVPDGGAARPTYTLSSSAAFDPYELDDANQDRDEAKLEAWLLRVEEEMKLHRSPFIAAEVVLAHMEECRATLHNPDLADFATALAVLKHCVPALTSSFQDVVSAAIHELIPAVSFVRAAHRQRHADGSAAGSPAASSAVETTLSRRAYADCFRRVYHLFLDHRRSLSRFHARSCVEERVMDRVVCKLDRLWVKMCFVAWKAHYRSIKEKTQLFRRLALRGTAGQVVPVVVRRWRQYAHAKMLTVKVTRRSEVSKEVEALYPVEQEAKSQHERASEEIREKMRLLEMSTARCEQTRARLDALQQLRRETVRSLVAHWAAWQHFVQSAFGDHHTLPSSLDDSDDASTKLANYVQNITDSSTTLAKRARASTRKLGMKQLAQFLRAEKALPPVADVNDAMSSASGDVGNRWLQVQSTLRYVLLPPPTVPLDVVTTVLQRACNGVVPPLTLSDVHLDHQNRLHLTLQFLSCLYSGGHCSQFEVSGWFASANGAKHGRAATSASRSTGSTASHDNRGPPSRQGTITAAGPGAPVSDGDDDVDVDMMVLPTEKEACGAAMISDVARGLERLEACHDHHDRYLMALGRCLGTSEMDVIHDYLGGLFQRWSVFGLPLNREKIEAVAADMVAAEDFPIIAALYPESGINTFSELVSYVTSVAEFSSWSLLTVAEKLDCHYAVDPAEELLLALHGDEVNQLLRTNADHLNRLFEWLKEEHAAVLSKVKTVVFLVQRVGLSESVAEEVWRGVGGALETEPVALNREELEQLLLLAAESADPSPFTPPVEKLARVLEICVPLLLNLS